MLSRCTTALVILLSSITFAQIVARETSLKFDPSAVRPWSKDDKSKFPTPLLAVFRRAEKSLIFVGDHHADQTRTSLYVEHAINRFSPEIVVVENLDFVSGKNPKKWMDRAVSKSKEELLKDGGANRLATLLAFRKKIPVIGGEPSLEEAKGSKYILSQGFDAEDILNLQVLQRLPYRRDVLKMSDIDEFFDYILELYKIGESRKVYKARFYSWYKRKTGNEFSYSKVTKAESAVNCLPEDTYLQKVACAINVNRDRAIVKNIETLLVTHNKILVVYGTGHFVQQYPVLLKTFGTQPDYIQVDSEPR